MSPQPRAFGDKPIVFTPSRNYTAADVPELVRIIGKSTWGNQTGALFDKLREPFEELQSTPAKIRLHNWYSTGIKTGRAGGRGDLVFTFFFDKEGSVNLAGEGFVFDADLYDGFDKAAKETLWGDGDGLVNLLSLKQVEEVWPKTERTSSRAFPNCTHFGILSDQRVLSALAQLLSGAQNSTALMV